MRSDEGCYRAMGVSSEADGDVCQPQTFAAEGDGDGVPAGGLVGFDEEEESVIDTLGMSVDGCAGPRVAGVLEG